MEGQTDIKNQQGSSQQQQNPASKQRERRTRSEPDPSSGRASDQQIETYPDQQRCRSIISISTQNQQQIFLSEPSLYGSQQNLQIFEWKYRQALESLEKELELGKMGSVLQDLQQEMLECFQTFRQHLINSIKINRKLALVQVSKHREPQRKKLKQELDETQKQSKKAVSQYDQLERQYKAGLDRKDPKQYDLKGAMERKFAIYTDFSTRVNYLNANLKKIYEEVERERLQTERAFAKQLEYKQKILAKQRETHEMIKRRIERKIEEDLAQTFNEDFMSTFQKQKRQENLKKLDGLRKNVFLFSNQPTLLQEYFQKLSSLEANIKSRKTSTQFIQEEFKDLKAFYMTFKENLIKTINTQEKLKAAEEQLPEARKNYQSAARKYLEVNKTQNANTEENMMLIFGKIYEDLSQTVKELKATLDTLDKNAKRKKRLDLEQSQSILKQVENYKHFHVDLEKKILQREQILAQLKQVLQQTNKLQDQRKRILEIVRNAQEQEQPKEEIGRLKTAAKELAQTHHEVKKESSQPTIIEVMQESSQSQNNEVKYERQPAANQVKQEFVEPAINQEKIEMPPLPRIPLFIGEFPVSENIKRVEPDEEKGQQKAGSREPSQVRSKDSKQRESENKNIRVKKLGKKSEDGSIESNQQNIGQQQSQIPVHIPSDSDAYKTKPTIKKFVSKSNKTVKSQVPPHESSAISDLSQKKPTDKEEYQRLLQNLKISIKTKDMKVEDIQRQFSSILYLFNNLVRDLQKKIEFHKAGPQRSERYQAKRKQLELDLEKAHKRLEIYQQRYDKTDSFYKEADSKNDPKAEKWAKFRLQDQRSLDLCKERVESLKSQRYQLEQEISQVKQSGVQNFTFQKSKLLNTQKDHTEIQKFISRAIRREIEPQLAALRLNMDQLQDQKRLITEKMHKAQEKEMSVKEMKQLKAEYNDVEKKIEETEQDIRINEEVLESQV